MSLLLLVRHLQSVLLLKWRSRTIRPSYTDEDRSPKQGRSTEYSLSVTKLNTMENEQLDRFENDTYQKEKEEFMSDKCSDCMGYLDKDADECDNNFCEGKIPPEYK